MIQVAPSRLTVLVLTCICLFGLYRNVEAIGSNHNILEVPVTASVESGEVIVRAADTGAVVPSQVERRDDGMRVTWIARDIIGKEPSCYMIETAGKPERADPRGVRLHKRGGDVEIRINGRLFTRYVFSGASKPYLYPVMDSAGRAVTRSFPMEEVSGESRDHPHQRSFWFTFGDVNGIDFWAETASSGKIVHREFERLEDGPVYGLIRTRNDWIAPDGKKVCEDVRELRVYRTSTGRLVDFEVTIRATDGPVKLGDTKEGMFGIRVADSIAVSRGKGHIENSRGNKDAEAWGKQAEWCDYYGPVDGETVGIAIMDHPTSFRHPTYWHVRTYGLFAPNPFGLKDFTGGEIADGSHTIPSGEEVTFRYRIFIHKGTTAEAGIREAYAAYSNPAESRVTVAGD